MTGRAGSGRAFAAAGTFGGTWCWGWPASEEGERKGTDSRVPGLVRDLAAGPAALLRTAWSLCGGAAGRDTWQRVAAGISAPGRDVGAQVWAAERAWGLCPGLQQWWP